MIYAAYFAAYTVCSPALGFMSDRYNVRILLTLFSAILACGALLMALAHSVVSACLFFTLSGIGHAACWAPVVALVQRWVNDKQRGTALAFVTLGSGMGIAVWSFLLPPIVRTFNWRGGWISMGLFGICVTALNYVLIRNPPNKDNSDPAQRRPAPPLTAAGYGQLLGNWHLWAIGLSYWCVGFTVLVPYTFIGVYAREELLLSYAVSTQFIAIIAVTGLLGKLVLGILSDYLGRINVMVLCGILLGVGCWGVANVDGIAYKFGFAGIFGAGFGAVWPVYAAAAPDFFPKSEAGSVIGLWTVFLGVGSIVSPIVCGWIIDLTGSFIWAFNLGLIGGGLIVLFLLPMVKAARR